MNTFNGRDVFISPLVQDTPKLKFDYSFLGGSTPAIDEFNRFLEARFGFKANFIITQRAIYTNRRGFDALKEACAAYTIYDNAKGGAA